MADLSVRCNKQLTDTSHLKTYMVTHRGVRVFQCRICEKSFKVTQANSLKTHMETHTGERAFQYHICEKSLTQTSS